MPQVTLSEDAPYLNNALALVYLSDAAYNDDAESDSLFKKTEFTDAFPFSDAKTETVGFVTVSADNFVISFRGTVNVKNWLTNLDFAVRRELGGKVHEGFYDALDAVWPKIVKLLQDKRDNQQTIWVCGHSLGGALAELAARRLVAAWRPFAACTFGQPRAADTAFANGFNRTLYRFVNNKDVVPTVPPRFVPIIPPVFYTHVGDLSFFNGTGKLVESDDTSKELGLTPDLLKHLAPLANAEAKAAKLIMDGVKDHAIANYVSLIEDSQP